MSQVGRFSEKHLHEAVGLNSFGREVGPFDAFNTGLRMHSERQSRDQLEFYEVSLQPAGPSEPSEEAIVSFLLSTFASRPPDLIVLIGAPASAFAHKYGQRLFFSTPMLITTIDQRRLPKGTFAPTKAVFHPLLDVPQVIETIHRVLPHTSTVFVVIGNSLTERLWREQFPKRVSAFSEPAHICLGSRISIRRNAKALCHSSAEFGNLVHGPGRRRISSDRGGLIGAAPRRSQRTDFWTV